MTRAEKIVEAILSHPQATKALAKDRDSLVIVVEKHVSDCLPHAWTSDIPTEAGWYWQRDVSLPHQTTRMVEVTKTVEGKCYYAGTNLTPSIDWYQWCGPIPQPHAS